MKSFPRPSLGSLRVFSACLLSFLMLMMPIAPLAAAATRGSSDSAARKSPAKRKPKLNIKEKSDLFVDQSGPAVGTPNITATMSDSFVDNNASGKADPGSTITYTATVSNTGTADANNVVFDDTPDPNTGQVVGSVKISPLAYADSYNTKQNTTLNVAAPGVLTNDSGLPAPTVGGVVGCVDVTTPFVCTTTQSGTLTLNADGSFTYTPPNAGFTGADTFTYTATNGQAPDDNALVTITVNANAAPVLANIEPGTLGYGNGSPPVQITNTLTVADADDTNIESATISITSNFVNGEDVLSFTNQNGITGNYVATTGILTLTGSATLANYQTALRSITYSDSAGSPTQSVRTVTFVVNDGDVNSNTQTRNINVANNTPPVANDDTASATEAGGTANGTAGTNPSGNLVTGVGVGSVADTDAEDPSSALVVVAVKTGPEGAPLVTGTVGNPLAGSYGSLTLNSNGSYTYTVDNNNATVQALRTSGNTLQDVFNYTIQDTGSAQDTATFTVTIAGANDAPTDIALSANTVPENQPINTVVGGFTSTDVDSGDTFTYTLVAGAGSTDNASFNISGANLQTSAAFDFETKSSYSIRVRTTDAGGLFFEKIFTITVTNVNETPTDIALSASSVAENQPINTVVGNFSTTDPDAGDTFTYTLVAGAGSTDNASFNINGAQLRTSAIFDFETKSSYSIRVRSTDAGSLFFEKQFTITVTNANDAPTDIALSNSSVPENQPINTVVGSFSTTDQDAGDTFTYTLVVGTGDTDNASFNISGANLRTSAIFDFETKSSYSIRVRSTDSGALFFEKQFTITVTNVNEAPVLTLGGGSPNYTEDAAPTIIDPAITVADVDSATLASGTIQITGNNQSGQDVLAFTNDGSTMGNIAAAAYVPATGLLTLTSAGGTATLAQWQSALRAVTYNNTSQNPNTTSRTISFKVNDGALDSNIVNKTMTVTAVNDAPVLAGVSGGFTYTENDAATAIATGLTITDVDSTTLTTATITLTTFQSGQDVLSFTNDGVTMGNVAVQSNVSGVLTLTSAGATATLAQWQSALRAVKYANSSDDPSTTQRTVSFQVNDGGAVNNLSNTVSRTIDITAVNDKPTANGFINLPAQAGIPISYPAAKLGGTDLEAGTTITINTTPDTLCAGCLLTINANGSFVFTPPPSAAGTTVSFTYHVSDNGNPGPGLNSDPATVSFAVAGPEIYFVKSAAVGVANCTLGNECTLTTAVTNIAARTNTRIFIEDANNHNSTVPLNSGGWLIGQGVTGTTFASFFGIGVPAQGTLATLPLLSQTRPTVQNTVTLNTNSTVRGLNISSTTNTGMADQAGAITGVSVSELAVTTTTGTGVNLSSIAGTLTFDGLTTAGGTGASLTGSNASATFNFSTVTISSGANAGFAATGGGTVNITGAANTITSTTGTALNVSNTTIGASGLTFRSITSNGAGTANGIILDTTGTVGGLTVTGNGGTCTSSATCTGGTISNKTGADGSTTQGTGIYLNSTAGVSLDRMQLNDFQNFGIFGSSVTGFTFTNSRVTGTNGTINSGASIEGSIRFNGLFTTGSFAAAQTAVVTGCTITGGAGHTFYVFNTSGTLNRLTVSTTTIGNTTLNSVSGLIMELQNTANGNITVNDSIFTAAQGNLFHAVSQASNTMDVVLRRNKFSNNHPTISNGGGGVKIEGGAGSANNPTVTYDVSCNTFRDAKGVSLLIFKGNSSGGTFTGSVVNNTVGVTGVSNSGGASGIEVDANGIGGTHTVLIQDNVIRRYNNLAGIYLSSNDSNATGGATLNATIFHNTTAEPESFAFAGLYADLGATSIDKNTMNVVVGSQSNAALKNDFSAGDPAGFSDVSLNRNQPSTTFNLYKNGSASATVTGVIQDDNLNPGTTSVSTTGTINLIAAGLPPAPPAVAACTLPPAAPPADDLVLNPGSNGSSERVSAEPKSPSRSRSFALEPVKEIEGNPAMATIAARNSATNKLRRGAQPPTLQTSTSETLQTAKVQTPVRPKTKQPAGRTLSHHPRGNAKARLATAMLAPPPPPPNFPQNIGTIPMGKSVTITFQVTLNTAMPFGTTQVSNQGSVSGSNFATVLTDDQPGTAAPNEPTITPIDAPTASASDVSGDILDSNGLPVEGAAVRMTGTQNRLTVTDANGHYHFDNVETNGFYNVTPSRVNFDFSPTDRSFSQLGNHTDAIFTGTYNGGTVNPLDTTEYFVRQQYVDFLNREPDEAGFNFWVNNIEACGSNQTCRAVKRTDTSAAFFLSVEFQQTGYLVYKIYQSAYGDMPGAPVPLTRSEFKPDTEAIGQGVIVNQTGWETLLENNKQAFANDFVSRSRFTTAYPTTMTPEAFVDKLFLNAGVTPSDTERSAAIGEFNSAVDTSNTTARAKALRRVAENLTLNQQEFNQAFVLMEYFGYLRRSPPDAPEPTLDYTGYNFWLSKLDRFNGDYRQAQMVQAFLVAGEYRQRFPK